MEFSQTKRQELAGLEAYRGMKINTIVSAARFVIDRSEKMWPGGNIRIPALAFKDLTDSVDSLNRLNAKIDSLKQMIQVAEEEVRALHTPATPAS